MAQVYAVMHDGHGNFMIAFKNTRGYFFHNPHGGGVIIPAGTPLNGALDWAFPGGRLEGTDTPIEGALREFLEETGTGLDPKQARPDYYRGDRYYGVYFNVGSNFRPLVSSVHMNLDLGHEAVRAIREGRYGPDQYADLMADYRGCPADNELSEAYGWNLRDDIYEVNRLITAPVTDWYFHILANLAVETYGCIVTAANGMMAGIGGRVTEIEGSQYLIDNFTEDAQVLHHEGTYTLHVADRETRRGLHFVSLDGGVATFRGH